MNEKEHVEINNKAKRRIEFILDELMKLIAYEVNNLRNNMLSSKLFVEFHSFINILMNILVNIFYQYLRSSYHR